MTYNLVEIENQIIRTLQANDTLQICKRIDTHAGAITPQVFLDPQFDKQGFINLLPFVYLEYRGRDVRAMDTSYTDYHHDLKFRLYIGAQSLRIKREAQLTAYEMLAAVYDSLHGKYPKCIANQNYNVTFLLGDIIQTSFNAISPLRVGSGDSEILIVNIPSIVVYQSDYVIQIAA